MAKEAEKQKGKGSKSPLYNIEGSKIMRTKKACPRCGSGVFMAEHQTRFYCGRCHYTQFKTKSQPAVQAQGPQVKRQPIAPQGAAKVKPAPAQKK